MIATALWEIRPEVWSALAAWSLVLLTVIGGVIAYRQLREARRLREEQAQPYVVVFMEDSAAGAWVLDLVVKNFGTTAATHVQLGVAPAVERLVDGKVETVALPDAIPVLVPGQEWRTFWDTSIRRGGSDLPDRHVATVTYQDSRGKQNFQYQFVLDWRPFNSRTLVTLYGAHDAAKALREISKTLARWNEGAGASGASVYVRDGDARDKRQRDQHASRQAAAAQKPQDMDAHPG